MAGYQGDLLKAMRKVFEEAKTQAPCILLLDEVDSFPDRAAVTHHNADYEIQVVNALLGELDDVEGREGVVVVAACNHPGKLDPALTRSGRLDRHIRVSRPDRAALALILREHLGADLPEASLSEATLAANGASGADCERFVRGARRRAREAGRAMTLDGLSDEIGSIDTRSKHEVVLAAVHEAGHAVMTTHLCPGTLAAVSVRATERGGGSTSSNEPASFLLAEDVHVRLVILLAGRAAEQVLLRVPSSGAGGGPDCDLALATGLATMAASALGFNTKVRLVWAGVPDDASLPRMLSEHPAIAAEVRRMLDMAYQDAMTLMGERQDALSALVKALVDRRALDVAEMAERVARHPGRGRKACAS